jgi:citrate lyase beta subunit
MATVESAIGVARLPSIARSSSRLTRLCFGAADFGLDLGLNDTDSRAPGYAGLLDHVRYQLVIASRAASLPAPHDSAYLRLNDVAGLRREAETARAMGFAGKHAIHPAQLAIINDVFSVSDYELERAERIVREFSAAQAAGTGVITIDDQVIDYPVYSRAKRLLATNGQQREHGATCV